MWIERTLKNKIKKACKARPAILLTGARQTGKSSLLKREFAGANYVSFDYLNQLLQAQDSPNYFLSQFKSQTILDEIQYIPELFRELKIFIDQAREEYGKWILTGSQQFELMEKISESLAGRISILHLETLSAQELRDSNIETMQDFLWKGGYPELWANKNIDVDDFFESYIKTYIERDLKNIIDVKNLNDFRRFFRVIATRIGQLINYKDIAKDVGVSDVTIRKWVHALEISGLIYLLPPFYANIGKRLIKAPKLFFADHGIVCYLLGIKNNKQWHDHTHRGHLWENFVLMELIKNNRTYPGKNIFFYRDHNGVEIDFVIEQFENIYLIEAKAGERTNSKKLNFSKVEPLLKKRYKTKNLLAQNITESTLIKTKEYDCFNPLKKSYEF